MVTEAHIAVVNSVLILISRLGSSMLIMGTPHTFFSCLCRTVDYLFVSRKVSVLIIGQARTTCPLKISKHLSCPPGN